MTLASHLETGCTTLCRCWIIRRTDGETLGFTDHDLSLEIGGVDCRPEAGLAARELVQGTGMAVDNSEAIGVLSSAAIDEAQLDAGRYDGAAVEIWDVNWRNPGERAVRFRGRIGDVRRGDGQFEAELRGLTDALNQPRGRTFQSLCAARLGDRKCGFDPSHPDFAAFGRPEGVADDLVFDFAGLPNRPDRWFERGTLRVTSGAAEGLSATIKTDRKLSGGSRQIALWSPLRIAVDTEDLISLEPGCDKRSETCRLKFNNYDNFRGFPDIPGEDWLASVPVNAVNKDGGSRR